MLAGGNRTMIGTESVRGLPTFLIFDIDNTINNQYHK
jgi:hypothetical protein